MSACPPVIEWNRDRRLTGMRPACPTESYCLLFRSRNNKQQLPLYRMLEVPKIYLWWMISIYRPSSVYLKRSDRMVVITPCFSFSGNTKTTKENQAIYVQVGLGYLGFLSQFVSQSLQSLSSDVSTQPSTSRCETSRLLNHQPILDGLF